MLIFHCYFPNLRGYVIGENFVLLLVDFDNVVILEGVNCKFSWSVG